MDKKQIQQEIAKTEAVLAELRESLDQPENVQAKFGEVWVAPHGEVFVTLGGESFCPAWPLRKSLLRCEDFSTADDDTRLGTHKEVFIRRSEVEAALQESAREPYGNSGGDVRAHIYRKLKIDY
jgi:hypothetical protein